MTSGIAYPQLVDGVYQNLVHSVFDNAVPGSSLANIVSRAAALDARLPAAPLNPILVVMVGINDTSDLTPSAFLTGYASYLDARRSAGWKVVLCPVLPALDQAGRNTWRNTVNTTLITWGGVHADAVVSNSDPTMWDDNAPNNSTLFLPDKLHPTLAGQTSLAPAVAAAIVSLVR